MRVGSGVGCMAVKMAVKPAGEMAVDCFDWIVDKVADCWLIGWL